VVELRERLGPYGLRALGEDRDQLGEGPVWNPRCGELWHVDIARGKVHASPPPHTRSVTFDFDGEVSSVVPRARGGMIVAIGHEIIGLDAHGVRAGLARVEPDLVDNRFNDCRCDAKGRLWAGTMSKTRRPGTAALYCLAPGEPIQRMVAGTTLSNGISWSPSGEQMYFVDSTTQRIDVFDFEPSAGAISNRRTLAYVEPNDGLPDGIAVDSEGGIWLCLFGGGALRRYSSVGDLEEEIQLPVSSPTCPTFGGPDLGTLYVTTAKHRLSRHQLLSEPLAGAVLALEPGVRGLPVNEFGG